METTERIVEAYVRYIKKWATIPNIRCDGQFEIDLLAIDPKTGDRYHIETSVSVSDSFAQLTAKAYSEDELKIRTKQATQRRTLGYFVERKFGHPSIMKALKEYGFQEGQYTKVIVTWGWEDAVEEPAREAGILLWDFRKKLDEIAHAFDTARTYFTDDTLRTLHLFAHAQEQKGKVKENG